MESDDVKLALDAVVATLMSKNADSSLVYANAAGYDSKTIDHRDLMHFYSYIEKSESEFLHSDIEKTKHTFFSDVELLLKSKYWKTILFQFKKKPASGVEYDRISRLVALLQEASLDQIASSSNYDIGAAAITRAVELKKFELIEILKKLEEKKLVLKPLLTRAIAKSKNQYGDHDEAMLFKEVDDFVEHYFPKESMSFYYLMKPTKEIYSYIEGWLDGHGTEEPIPDEGIDFEFWCANQLEKQGWRANVTKASGDQGVDIEAWRGGFCVVVQCKRYNQPIGNKAVQEVYAGKQHRYANAAAIIGTGGFTKSAIELAIATSVKLFDAEEIEFFSERFS